VNTIEELGEIAHQAFRRGLDESIEASKTIPRTDETYQQIWTGVAKAVVATLLTDGVSWTPDKAPLTAPGSPGYACDVIRVMIFGSDKVGVLVNADDAFIHEGRLILSYMGKSIAWFTQWAYAIRVTQEVTEESRDQ
jgi:hypothetical protein